MGLFEFGKKAAKSEKSREVVRSMKDYLEGIAQVHKDIAAVPGAQRIDPKLREAQAAMNPKQVLEQYNENQLFGKTPSGEPLRGVIQDKSSRDYVLHTGSDLPDKGKFLLFPESKVPRDLSAGLYIGPQMDFYKKYAAKDDAEHAHYLQKLMSGQNNPRAIDPRMYSIYAMNVNPSVSGSGHWSEGLRSRGKEMYGALYDMMRAGGHGNFADVLTPVNTVRRLGNVGSHAIGHGNLGFISPIDESLGYTTQLPGFKFRGGPDIESEYLDSLFLTSLRPNNAKVVADISKVGPRQLAALSDDQRLGLLYLREAQLTGGHGPSTAGGQLTRLYELEPHDIKGLTKLAEPYVTGHPGDLPGAFGPSTIGRQVTTENVVRAMMMGHTPEEITYDLLKRDPEGGLGFKGRYAKGGLASALEG